MARASQLSDHSEPIELRVEGIVTVEQYRKITKDKFSSDAKILERILYLERFCRAVIQNELNNHGTKV